MSSHALQKYELLGTGRHFCAENVPASKNASASELNLNERPKFAVLAALPQI
jgi:hypothetical protein